MELAKNYLKISFLLCFQLNLSILSLSLIVPSNVIADDSIQFGPLLSESPLTLDSGNRLEAAGPFFYFQHEDSEKTWAVPPFFSHDADSVVGSSEDDFLYPLLTYRSYGKEYRWQLIQLLSFSGGEEPNNSQRKRFTIFPFYFQQRSPVPADNYTAFVPFYGHLQNRLFRDRMFFVMFPIYGETQKRDVITDNYFYPFFHLRHGDGMSGWQLWPVVGDEHKVVTTKTNGFGDVEMVGGYDRLFALWPFYFRQNNGIGTDDPQTLRAVIPLYVLSRSPKQDSSSVLWPFFTWIDARDKQYHEWQGPWPFVIFARGEGKTTSRVWPLFSRSHNKELESDSYLWPVYTFHRIHSDPLDHHRMRILYYLFDDSYEANTETGKEKSRLSAWPFFIYHRDFNGSRRLQIVALLEPILPDNTGIERNWSPLWSLWRSEKNPQTAASSQSLLWNTYRHDQTPTSNKCSLLFGLFRYQSGIDGKKVSVLFIPLINSHKRAK
jgi:hypothetical protein